MKNELGKTERKPHTEPLFLWRACPEDVIVARNAAEARSFYEEEHCLTDFKLRRIYNLDAHSVWWMFRDLGWLEDLIAKHKELKVGSFMGELAVLLTYRQALMDYDGDVPCIFSSTEW